MATSALTGSNAATINQMNSAASTSKSDSSRNSLAGTFDTFLTMLTTQLKNQDPLSPMDSTQFTNQLVLFSGVEQQINANSNLEKLISLQSVSQQASAIGYIGQTVTSDGTSLPVQGGAGLFEYNLPSDAAKLSVSIKDKDGNVITTLSQPDTTTGVHRVAWDGKDASGKQLDDGTYTISIAATDSNGDAMDVPTTVYGVVTGVTSDATTNGTLLQMGSVSVPLANVKSVVTTLTQN